MMGNDMERLLRTATFIDRKYGSFYICPMECPTSDNETILQEEPIYEAY
jgi:hypothetical protein